MKNVKKQILLSLFCMMMVTSAYASQNNQNNKPSLTDKMTQFLSTEEGIRLSLYSISVGLYAIFVYWVITNQSQASVDENMTVHYPSTIATKFNNVAGLDGVKEDMKDIISYLANPEKYKKIGAQIPKGILMEGGPGNGKTLIARAMAGEAQCPCISVSGSYFVQMYVGIGAARMRELFAKAKVLAKKYGSCIIFIDEIDSFAKIRNGWGANSETDQTLTQLLTLMDGFNQQENPIIVIGATNRVDMLDSALIRPGRFDKVVKVTKPYFKDRIELITIALEKIPHAPDIDIENVALFTNGFSGAELAQLCNEAAIIAVSNDREIVQLQDIEQAFDHCTLGREIKGMKQSETVKKITAIHEAGHAIGWIFGGDVKYRIHKASIVPRSHTLGVVYAMPLYESYESRQEDMKASIAVCLCGGLAEQEFGYAKGTGISSDLVSAREIARQMVLHYGMSDDLEYMSYDYKLSDTFEAKINEQVEKIVRECFVKAKQLIANYKQEISQIADLLMEKGTVLGSEIYELLHLPVPGIEIV